MRYNLRPQTSNSKTKAKYRLARVMDVHPDVPGVVRSVTVGTRNLKKAAKERPQVCKSGLVQQVVPVQRLVIVLPANEMWVSDLSKQ